MLNHKRGPMKNLKDIRQKKKMTQIEVANAVGVSVEAYRRWENGGGGATIKNLKKLNSVLGIEIAKGQ